jgi:hypothetical protein
MIETAMRVGELGHVGISSSPRTTTVSSICGSGTAGAWSRSAAAAR